MRLPIPLAGFIRAAGFVVTLGLWVGAASGQTPVPQTTVPQVLPVSGTLVGTDGKPLTGDAVVTFAVYDGPEDGTPLWAETQTVSLDERGRFSAWVGTQGSGLPMDIFQTGLARWMGVQPAGHPEQPRARFLAVPYALKALDAETLGGLPVSAFLRGDQPSLPAAPLGKTSPPAFHSSNDPPTPATGNILEAGTNTALGQNALGALTSGTYNVAIGADAMKSNTTAHSNTGVGAGALYDNTTGIGLAATGFQALASNTSGRYSVAAGYRALYSNTTGESNIGLGYQSLYATTTGNFNVAVGVQALLSNVLGHSNVAVGPTALFNATGSRNVALGYQAGWNASTGSDNVYIANTGVGGESGAVYLGTIGTHTKTVLAGNVGVGTTNPAHKLDVSGSVNTSGTYLFGAGAYGLRHYGGIVRFDGGSDYPDGYRLATGGKPSGAVEILDNGNVGIGIAAPVQPLHVFGNIRTDATFLFGSGYGMRATGGVVRFDGGTNYPEGYSFATSGLPSGAVTITNAGNVGLGTLSPTYPLDHASGAHLTAGGVWTNASSRALKDRIAPLTVEAAEAALAALQPVTYVYKADPGDPQVGFIAEDVPQLVATNDRTSLAPMDIVAVLTKVAQQQRETIQQQRQELEAQGARLQTQDHRLAAQAAALVELRERLAALEQLLSRQR